MADHAARRRRDAPSGGRRPDAPSGGGRHDAVAICTPGLEPIVVDELEALGCKPKAGAAGVVPFKATNRQLYAANLWLRSASRVLIRIARFRATDFAHLQLRASEIDWGPWIADDWAPEFRVSSAKSRLYHTEGIADRLHKIVGPRTKGEPAQPFVVRFDRDLCTISVDSGGSPLNHRGWRSDLGVAPLRPTMAAAMLLSAGYDGSRPLVDPFCGSGTIAIEAALMARRRPPGGERRFAFQSWPGFEPGTWASVNGAAKKQSLDAPPATIEAFDRDENAVAATRANAERAGVADDIDVQCQVVSHLGGKHGAGLVVTNPPYGKRVGDGDLKGLYKRFGAVLRDRRPEWDLTLVTAEPSLARQVDQRLRPVTRFGHGGIKVHVYSRTGSAPTITDDAAPRASAPN